jgi:PD-(D/E)XK endonuclease
MMRAASGWWVGSRGRTSTPGIFSEEMLTPREQGDMGERAALHWLMGQGAHVSIPFGHSPHYDLVADFGDELLRVQVKTSACRYKQRWAVTVCTRGANQSWQGLVKRLDPSRFDHLFVLVADGRQWFIPASRIEGATAIHLGGPKYSEFEVEQADPIPATSGGADASTIDAPDPRGDVRVAKGGGL